MWNQISWWDRIVGTWAIAAGVSLLWTFFKQYRGRVRYLYLVFFGGWGVLYGLTVLRVIVPLPRWVFWVIFLAGFLLMFGDSARRFRETNAKLREERMRKLQNRESPPGGDAEGPAGEGE